MRKKTENKIPTLEEVREYVSGLHTYFTPELFFNYYQAIGWKFNHRRIYDWKAVARFWAGNEAHKAQTMRTAQQTVDRQQQIAEEREKQQAERERAYEESVRNHVSYAEYLQMKAAGKV